MTSSVITWFASKENTKLNVDWNARLRCCWQCNKSYSNRNQCFVFDGQPLSFSVPHKLTSIVSHRVGTLVLEYWLSFKKNKNIHKHFCLLILFQAQKDGPLFAEHAGHPGRRPVPGLAGHRVDPSSHSRTIGESVRNELERERAGVVQRQQGQPRNTSEISL